MKSFLMAVAAGVVAALVSVFAARFLFGQDISGLTPAIAGSVAGVFVVMYVNGRKKTTA